MPANSLFIGFSVAAITVDAVMRYPAFFQLLLFLFLLHKNQIIRKRKYVYPRHFVHTLERSYSTKLSNRLL